MKKYISIILSMFIFTIAISMVAISLAWYQINSDATITNAGKNDINVKKYVDGVYVFEEGNDAQYYDYQLLDNGNLSEFDGYLYLDGGSYEVYDIKTSIEGVQTKTIIGSVSTTSTGWNYVLANIDANTSSFTFGYMVNINLDGGNKPEPWIIDSKARIVKDNLIFISDSVLTLEEAEQDYEILEDILNNPTCDGKIFTCYLPNVDKPNQISRKEDLINIEPDANKYLNVDVCYGIDEEFYLTGIMGGKYNENRTLVDYIFTPTDGVTNLPLEGYVFRLVRDTETIYIPLRVNPNNANEQIITGLVLKEGDKLYAYNCDTSSDFDIKSTTTGSGEAGTIITASNGVATVNNDCVVDLYLILSFENDRLHYTTDSKPYELKVNDESLYGMSAHYVDNKVYLDVSWNAGDGWSKDGARFAAYFIDANKAAYEWVSMTQIEENIYYCNIPTTRAWTYVIFCRMNPANKANNWDNKWNQTGDIVLDASKNLYVISGWDTGSWSNTKYMYTTEYETSVNFKSGDEITIIESASGNLVTITGLTGNVSGLALEDGKIICNSDVTCKIIFDSTTNSIILEAAEGNFSDVNVNFLFNEQVLMAGDSICLTNISNDEIVKYPNQGTDWVLSQEIINDSLCEVDGNRLNILSVGKYGFTLDKVTNKIYVEYLGFEITIALKSSDGSWSDELGAVHGSGDLSDYMIITNVSVDKEGKIDSKYIPISNSSLVFSGWYDLYEKVGDTYPRELNDDTLVSIGKLQNPVVYAHFNMQGIYLTGGINNEENWERNDFSFDAENISSTLGAYIYLQENDKFKVKDYEKLNQGWYYWPNNLDVNYFELDSFSNLVIKESGYYKITINEDGDDSTNDAHIYKVHTVSIVNEYTQYGSLVLPDYNYYSYENDNYVLKNMQEGIIFADDDETIFEFGDETHKVSVTDLDENDAWHFYGYADIDGLDLEGEEYQFINSIATHEKLLDNTYVAQVDETIDRDLIVNVIFVEEGIHLVGKINGKTNWFTMEYKATRDYLLNTYTVSGIELTLGDEINLVNYWVTAEDGTEGMAVQWYDHWNTDDAPGHEPHNDYNMNFKHYGVFDFVLSWEGANNDLIVRVYEYTSVNPQPDPEEPDPTTTPNPGWWV